VRAVLALLALALSCAGAGAAEIRRYDTAVEIAQDGTARATANLTISGATAGRLRVPVGFPTLDDFQPRDGPPGVVMTPRQSPNGSSVDLVLPEGAPSELNIGFSFQVGGALFVPKPEEGQKSAFPIGSRLVRHGFVNTQEAVIGRYAVKVLLPEDSVVHRVREELPKPKRKEFLPRVELDRFEGRQGAILQLAGLRQGDRTSMELEVVESRRSFGWLFILLPVAVAYLYAFRDLVKRNQE
jgi:hypothetical protein